MAWPKIIEIAGIKVPVDSWAELKEAIQEFGPELVNAATSSSSDESPSAVRRSAEHPSVPGLSHGDRTLLTQFIEAGERGLLTGQLSQALGKRGKGVRPALEKWSRRVGLVTEDNASAFEPVKRFDGRGFRMVDHYRRTAASMIGQSV